MKTIYNSREIESKWQKYWQEYQTYKTSDRGEKQYVLGMFPYPSGDGLHVGHVRIYTGTDVLSRFLRMKGKKVLHPMGWDAFGLPTENAAIKAKINPKILARRNIDNFRRQMQMIGFGYDWSREFATTDPDYYRWTQWLFLKMYGMKNEKGERLIYRKRVSMNWCESCKTGLANEEVLADGSHERCGKPVTQRETDQWLMRITDYADRLLKDLDGLDWPRGILEMQRDWIGKTRGLNIDFIIRGLDEPITVWTKFWETVFGTTFLVLAPEHPLVGKLPIPTEFQEKVHLYIDQTATKTERRRKIEEKDKTGVFTGVYAINPVNGQEVPIWIADYVLRDIGTGAVMGVPAHDGRDFDFTKKHGLKIIQVVSYLNKSIDEKVKKGEMAYEDEGALVNSGDFDGMRAWGDGKQKMAQWMIEKRFGRWKISYHLRDWIFSRQHYWGEPIPFIYCDKCGDENRVVPIPDDQLPVELPDVTHYEPTTTGKSPLSQIKNWVNVKCPVCGGPAKRETDTMPNWAGSCWYFLRFADPKNSKEPFSKSAIAQWLPVDWYLGGAEHAVLHLLYARFWMKAFADLGFLSISEPFTRLRSVGMVLGEGHAKMSKSVGNIINPDEIVAMYGADTLRIYEMFMGPWNQVIAWSMRGAAGSYRFLERVYRLALIDEGKIGRKSSRGLKQKLAQLADKVTRDIPAIKFNTAIAAFMKFVNSWEEKGEVLSNEDLGVFARLLAPFAPHLAEEIWLKTGNQPSVHLSEWPSFNEKLAAAETARIPVQVNGKTRAIIEIEMEKSKNQNLLEKIARKNPSVVRHLAGKKEKQAIFVSGKILNFVIE